MDPSTLLSLLSGGSTGLGGLIKGGTQMFQGLADTRKGKRLEEEAGERPEFDIPESVDQVIRMYEQMSRSGLPGQDLMQQDIQASTARTATTAGQLADSPIAALTALGGAQQRELSALRDLQTRAASYQAQARQGLAGAHQMKAGYETEQWRQNQLLPWEIGMNRAMQLQTAGRGNMMAAADTFGSMFALGGEAMGGMAQQGGGAQPTHAPQVMGMPPVNLSSSAPGQIAGGINYANTVPYDQIPPPQPVYNQSPWINPSSWMYNK